MNSSFKQFAPLNRLNAGLVRSKVFKSEKEGPFLSSTPRYQRFLACMESFGRNLLGLEYILDRISSHFHITYSREDRRRAGEYRPVKNIVLLRVDLIMFFMTTKILLDNVAFFTPFYYREPIMNGKGKDVRDLERPWDFRSMKSHFTRNNRVLDQRFCDLLRNHSPWTDEICDIRKFLVHRFHDLLIDHDFWTRTYFAFLYEFNRRKDFIPDVLSYVAKVYFKFVRFLRDYEALFKYNCENQFASFEYFFQGGSYAKGLDEKHLFFVSLGRILNNKILIRIHPNRRDIITSKLEEIMREEKCTCNICGSYNFQIRPTVEQYILISVQCGCGKRLPIPFLVEKKFFPYFMVKNRRENLWGLIPYTLNKAD